MKFYFNLLLADGHTVPYAMFEIDSSVPSDISSRDLRNSTSMLLRCLQEKRYEKAEMIAQNTDVKLVEKEAQKNDYCKVQVGHLLSFMQQVQPSAKAESLLEQNDKPTVSLQ